MSSMGRKKETAMRRREEERDRAGTGKAGLGKERPGPSGEETQQRQKSQDERSGTESKITSCEVAITKRNCQQLTNLPATQP
ncbi:hypothetical protein Mapa_002543 [Marchantia paleacea]|nr:hypothetical protein Mapa_002543 [Marchantia paleacea]